MEKEQRIAVFGGGSWATALVKLLTNNVNELSWYMRNYSDIEYIREYGHNPRYLSDVELDTSKIHLCDNINEAIENASILILAIPSAFLNSALSKIKTGISDKKIISAIKGIVPEHDLIIGDYLNQEYAVPFTNIGVVAGPCHSEEVALERLSYLTIASQDNELADFVAGKLRCRYLQTFTSDDIFGTEYSAVLKNIYALAAGICHGIGYGDNFQAVLISNAIREIKRFADTVHPISRDIKDSAYLGDLLVTAYSNFSRNRQFGGMIGKGHSVKTVLNEMNMVAEGYYAALSIHRINTNYNVDMPIAEAVYNILYGKIPARIEIKRLTMLLT
ncbi:MAG: NAD(P)H-dependent glycerol-3-phosphate dehydrogenase [Bacteroidales bacterium]|nr:NAD(P)H-dependent glycerol-3-phosphate dehydrogenase [Bacteroidales bacterium]MCF8457372.1 NAD(P)H-dependent glycerol-3-phosphate dehydrogenase [Bacteroidales bacterium]